ncbi:MAG: hypothetical protein EON60_13655 [Alphaproteobacteria bacterium]|nr:MAG: hypothetical protein EON60_13655 [Alphaproteobacteria bacterium]
MDFVGILTFCKQHQLADKLDLPETEILQTIRNEVTMLLDSGLTPRYAAHAALTHLEIIAGNKSEDDTHVNSIMPLEDELTALITHMVKTEIKSIILKDTVILEDFFQHHKIAETLRIPPHSGLQNFLSNIQQALLFAKSPEQIAEDTIFFMESIADTYAARTKNYSYQTITGLRTPLIQAIQRSVIESKA